MLNFRGIPSILLCAVSVILFLFSGSVNGHVVNQLFLSLEKSGEEWVIDVTFDAGYALPEFRNDPDSPQPQREWLFTLEPDEHQRLRQEAADYLKESLFFTHGKTDTPLSYQISFPNYKTSPPSFPKMLNGGAYFSVLISGETKNNTEGGFKIHVYPGDRPDFIIASGPENNRHYHVVRPNESSVLYNTKATSSDVEHHHPGWLDIVGMGYLHVLPMGMDHILFILALFLMARRWKPLLAQSLIFTLAHCITLGLSVTGVIQVQQWSGNWLIEPLIALSITVVALENIFSQKASPQRLLVVFIFGLIHGLGFGGSLGTALDQENQNSILALAFANLGVELAQITILASAWILTIGWWKSKFYEKFRIWSSVIIAIVGILWVFERLLT